MRATGKFLLSAFAATMLVATGAAASELRIGLALEPSSIDPHYHNLGPNNSVARHVFGSLVLTDEKLKHQPGLAVSWKPVDDTTWEFKLRQGVKFHDGTPFTADDVIFTMERAPAVPQSPSSFGIYVKGKTFQKVDDFTVRVSTETPYPLMATDLSNLLIVSKKNGEGATTADYNSGKAAIGTGPYKFVEWVPGDRLVLEKYADYWGKTRLEDAPTFDRVVMKPIKSDPSRVAALLAGDVDMIDNVPTADIANLKTNAAVGLSQGVSTRIIYLHLDSDRDVSPFVTGIDGKNPLKDVRVRRAMSMAINREAIVERVMEGVAVPAGQFLPEGFFGYTPDLKPMPYDPEGAKKLLAEAGYPNGFGITLHGPNNRYINDAKIAQAVGQMLTRVGIDTKVDTMPSSVFFTAASSGGPDKTPKFSFILVGWGTTTGEPSSPLRSLIMTYDPAKGWGGANRGRFSNPELDALVEKALATNDDAKREEMLVEATKMAIEEVAVIPMHFQVNTWASKKGLGYVPRADEYTMAMSVTTN